MKRKPLKKKMTRSSNGDTDLLQVGVRLPRDQIELLDARATTSGGRLNRSDLIRQAIDKFFE